MNTRQRNVLIRVITAVLVFIYIGYMAWRELPRFDFTVIMSFFALYLLWTIVAETLIYTDPDTYVIEDDDRKSIIYIQLSFIVALFFAAIDFVELNLTRIKTLEPIIIYIGFTIFIISCIIRWWGFNSIGKFFNPRVAIYEDHVLIRDGAYKHIRHPLYLGSLLSTIAIPLVFNSWGAMLIIIFSTIPAVVYRIKVEEELMLKYFKDEYHDYMRNTKKIIPGIW